MKKETRKVGMGFSETLTLIFIVLKLCKIINWSWWWVLSPLLIGYGILIITLTIYMPLKN